MLFDESPVSLDDFFIGFLLWANGQTGEYYTTRRIT